MYDDYTADELASLLENLWRGDPIHGGPLMTLDYASRNWVERYPQIAEKQQAFSEAREAHRPTPNHDGNWTEVVRTASELAAALRAAAETNDKKEAPRDQHHQPPSP
ncbi:hypothetical protein ACQEVX_23185 [Streptomyces syringium]|uniref:hypothetical protein n=1 Tax=Streptomyces syringium TaxID=76729 RepID=UPI003D8C5024